MASKTKDGSKKRKKNDGPIVMEGQTEEERRALRQEQRALFDSMADRHTELAQLSNEAFGNERTANNDLFAKVRFTREMGTDGENLEVIAKLAEKRSGQLNQAVSIYSSAAVVKELRRHYADDAPFSWARLGADCAHVFRAAPELSFLCGPLNKPEKEKKTKTQEEKLKEKAKKTKATADDGDDLETRYDTTTGGTADAGQQDEATNMRLDAIVSVMEQKMASSGLPVAAPGAPQAGLDVMQLLVNKDSFCETVENFFDLSFLVKDGRACLEIDPATGLPCARLTQAPEEAIHKTQNVVVLSMADTAQIAELWRLQANELKRAGAE
ncbi:hypothetical protein M885DRAFT_546521 [Pelagophyceae sp. CCMP2097]|nr:hypothetical protein M885DRAFT_546521 [Pelagophyceae sp. CCMP2097]|mmetsp:Transcript_12446/g.43994  ORF Transcript_12446/g.43994 Transcript_12446/m.43994 type:complete len:326 (+) Transcript_12446:320-1297(+)